MRLAGHRGVTGQVSHCVTCRVIRCVIHGQDVEVFPKPVQFPYGRKGQSKTRWVATDHAQFHTFHRTDPQVQGATHGWRPVAGTCLAVTDDTVQACVADVMRRHSTATIVQGIGIAAVPVVPPPGTFPIEPAIPWHDKVRATSEPYLNHL